MTTFTTYKIALIKLCTSCQNNHPAPFHRPQRERKQNVKYSPDEWELRDIATDDQFVPTMAWCLDMIRWIAQREEVGGKREGGDK